MIMIPTRTREAAASAMQSTNKRTGVRHLRLSAQTGCTIACVTQRGVSGIKMGAQQRGSGSAKTNLQPGRKEP